MTLPEATDPSRVPFFWYNAGGVIVNLLLLALSIVALLYCDLGMVGETFFMMLAFTGAFIAFFGLFLTMLPQACTNSSIAPTSGLRAWKP